MNEVEQFLERNVLNWQQESYVLAVSGGVDSMVLLEQFFQLQKKYPIIITVFHIHHHLRQESDE